MVFKELFDELKDLQNVGLPNVLLGFLLGHFNQPVQQFSRERPTFDLDQDVMLRIRGGEREANGDFLVLTLSADKKRKSDRLVP